MAYLKRPQRGERVLQSLFDSVNSIIDYLPTITVRGDNYSTSVEHSSAGTIIHAKQNTSSDQTGGKKYEAGSGLTLSGNVFSNALSGDGRTIAIKNNIISCLLTPSGGGSYTPDGNTLYTGELNVNPGSGFIWVDPNTLPDTDTHVICSNLRWIKQLANDNLCNASHFLQTSNLKEGAGTTINYHYTTTGNHTADQGEGDLISFVDGLEVDVNISGGRFIEGKFHKGVGYGDSTQASIDCLLSGDNNHIFIGQVDLQSGLVGGIISTNIHGDDTTIKLLDDGTISCLIGGGNWTSLTPNLLSVDNNNHTLSAATQGGSGPDNDTTYTGGRFINVDASGENPHTISCTLSTLAELANTPGFVTSSNFYAGKNILLSCETFTANNNVNIGTEANPIYQRIDVPVANSIKIINLLSGGTYIEVNDQTHAINCTLSGLDQLANTATNYITLAQVPAAIPHIPVSGLMSTALLEDDELIGIQYGLISAFYNDLTTISNRPSAGNFVLGSLDGQLTWLSTCQCDEVNNA